MNIREELLKYTAQSKEQALRIAEYASFSEDNFRELIACFVADDIRLAQRAAWSVNWAAQKKPLAVQPYIGSLVNQLKRTDVHHAVIRNSLRVLDDLKLPEQFHGEVLDSCFGFVQNRDTPVAIKAFSLKILFSLSQVYPEIKNELKVIIQEKMDYESAAFRSRGRKILDRIDKTHTLQA
jgi:hypothetical protein